MIFGTHLALDNSDHVLDGGPNPPTEGGTSPPLKHFDFLNLRTVSALYDCSDCIIAAVWFVYVFCLQTFFISTVHIIRV